MTKTDLRKTFNQFQEIPFPPVSNDEVISRIHDELAEWDGYMAGHILTHSIEGRDLLDRIESKTLTVYEDELKNRLVQKPELNEEIGKFISYINEWKKLIELAKKTV